MKRFTFLLFILVAGVSSAPAQTMLLKNGNTVSANGLVRKDDMVTASIKSANGATGQVAFHVSDIVKLDLPTPEALTQASAQIAKGNFDRALAVIEPALAYQKTIRDIPGNLWAKAAVIEIAALSGLNRLDEATALSNEISGFSQDPEILLSAKMQIALATKFKDSQQALAAFDGIISQSADPETLSRAWIAEGDVHLAEHEFDDALMAYLTVTVFYPKSSLLVPKALWGAGQAYAKLKDSDNATKTFQELITAYPDTPEASLAKTELQKKDKKT